MFSNSSSPTCILSYLRTQRLQQSFLLLWAEKWTSPRADPPESSILRPCLICTRDRAKLCSACNSKVHQVKPLDLEKLKLAICRWSRLIFSSRAITLEARPASSLHCWTRRLPNLTDGVKQFFSHTYTYIQIQDKGSVLPQDMHRQYKTQTQTHSYFEEVYYLSRADTTPSTLPRVWSKWLSAFTNWLILRAWWQCQWTRPSKQCECFFFMINIFIIQGCHSGWVGRGGQLVRLVV